MKLSEYYNRILPVVGTVFREKTVAFINPTTSCLITDALARCGTIKQLYFFCRTTKTGDAISLTYGHKYDGLSAGVALQEQLSSHNTLEKEWGLDTRSESSLQEIAEVLQEQQVDLIVGGGDLESAWVANSLAKLTNIPTVGWLLFKNISVQSAVFVSGANLPDPLFDDIAKQMSSIVEDEINLHNNLVWLETMDLVMNYVKTLFLRGTEFERKDLEKLFFQEKRNFVLRGTAEWPWWVHYVNSKNKFNFLTNLFATKYFVPPIPEEAFQEDKVMIIGCGTGSLIISDLVNYFNDLLLVDHKSFSAYNPVRQLIGTSWVTSELKPFVLQKFLAQRVDPDGKWKKSDNGPMSTVSNGKYSFSAADLLVREDNPESLSAFEDLLDLYNPTLVIVSTGRTYDDNFTICEILRKRGVKHIVPSAFPGATHYKVVVVNGDQGPCYECFQNNLTLDVTPGVTLNEDMRSMLYTDPDDPTQPATIIETWPSAHLALRLALELSLPDYLRSSWFFESLKANKICFVGGNYSEAIVDQPGFVYGVEYPGQVVLYGIEDVAGLNDSFVCSVCGQKYHIQHKLN